MEEVKKEDNVGSAKADTAQGDHANGDQSQVNVGPRNGPNTGTMARQPLCEGIDKIPAVRHYLERVDAEARSMLRAAVISPASRKGYRRDLATIDFTRDGEVTVKPRRGTTSQEAKEFEPSEKERAEIKEAFIGVKFPVSASASVLPEDLRQIPRDQLFVFRDRSGNDIRMAVQRVDKDDGSKVYITHSPWSDGRWRVMEPEGLLPLFGMETFKGSSRHVMIHEGPKSARAAQMAAKDHKHPWHRFLSTYTHLGWHGGAERPEGTDWGSLKGLEHAIIIPDNDDIGREAIKEISKRLPKTAEVYTIQWPSYFNDGWDMADPVPARATESRWSLWDNGICPATFATELISADSNKVAYGARKQFVRMWWYSSHDEKFVLRRFPNVRMSSAQFNNHHRPYSDVRELADLVRKQVQIFERLTYLPGNAPGPVGDGAAAQLLNVYAPTRVRPRPGDITPWEDFLKHLLPIEEERQHVEDWIATLIAHPEKRPGYGLLLISVQEGTGKGTLVDLIRPLVGEDNVSFPSANMIVDTQFNGWLAHKTLIFCPEIYEGHNWKAANKIKAYITDPTFEVNIKFEPTTTLPNCAWFILASNDPNCLKIDPSDRRWFVPAVTEKQWPQEKWVALRDWMIKDGHSAVLDWARNYETRTGRKYLTPGAKTPMTARKAQMIEDSEDREVLAAVEFLDYVAEQYEKEGKPRRFTFKYKDLRVIADGIVNDRWTTLGDRERLSDSHFSQRLGRRAVRRFPKRVGADRRTLYCFGEMPTSNDEALKLELSRLSDYFAMMRKEFESGDLNGTADDNVIPYRR